MLSRRSFLIATVLAAALSPAFAASPQPFNAQAFADAQKAGKPILIAIHASWCPTSVAERFCRTVNRINPARVCGSYRRLGRGAFALDLASLCALLQ